MIRRVLRGDTLRRTSIRKKEKKIMIKSERTGEACYERKKVLCTVKSVHREGVAVNAELDGEIVNGTISPRCYGLGAGRLKSLAAIKPGDKIEAVVRSYDAHTRSCSLVLPGFEDLPRVPKKLKVQVPSSGTLPCHVKMQKTPFAPEDAGTTFVFDFANICAALPMRVLPNAKAAIEGRPEMQGHHLSIEGADQI